MALVEDNRRGGNTFTWSIHNFGYYVKKEIEYLDSSEFMFNMDTTKWCLRLYPRGDGASGFISYYLNQNYEQYLNNFSVHRKIVDFVLSVRMSNGKYKEFDKKRFIAHEQSVGYKFFLSVSELNEHGFYLDNDTLTLRCRMWKNETDLSEVNYYGYTKIKVSKVGYTWILNEVLDSNNDNTIIKTIFDQKKCIQSSAEIPLFNIQLMDADDTIHFAIEQPQRTTIWYMIYMIHLLDVDLKSVHYVRGEHMFQNIYRPHIYSFPLISKLKLLSKEKLYLPGGRLTLRCEFSVSVGNVISDINRFEYGRIDDPKISDPRTSIQQQDQTLPGLWKENMQRFYQEGKFSDVVVSTPNRQFPAHKALLCAQSDVFSAMFERDMKENRTGVVEIEDLEDDTVSKMLMFLYTNTLEDLDFSMACRLYFAADKYQITALHKKCSNYLIHGLDASNVCDVLALADTHQDQELKSVVRGFIFEHDYKVMNSEGWKKLMETKFHLTSETMQLMITKKYLAYPKP